MRPILGRVRSRNKNWPEITRKYEREGLGWQEMLSINVAIVLVTLISPAHAVEQNVTVLTDSTNREPPAAASETIIA